MQTEVNSKEIDRNYLNSPMSLSMKRRESKLERIFSTTKRSTENQSYSNMKISESRNDKFRK